MTWPGYWDEETGAINNRAAVAIHEAGHAVMICRLQDALGVDMGAVEIREAGPDFHGQMMYAGNARTVGFFLPGWQMRAFLNTPDAHALNWEREARKYKAAALLALAGFAAEKIAGETPDVGQDYEDGGGGDFSNTEDAISTLCALAGRPSDDALYDRYCAALESLAYRSLLVEWEAVEKVAHALYERGSLTGPEVCALYQRHGAAAAGRAFFWEGMKTGEGEGGAV